ncbi:PTS sugar transporter subunit IIA [Pseudocitrobacter cyperus]|uniref:Ascorbate-specific PTS system EIIA component n=1 Tax=Pseudocitrobacter cyperus TaxID=3112843 RepID=A0ABV0HFG4_9ENTR
MDNPFFSAYQHINHPIDWKHAIKLACFPLEQQGKVSAGYAGAIIQATEENGPWYILSPEFALPHARPEEGVLSQQSCLSLLCCSEKIEFPGHPDVRFIIVLAAANSQQHILMIQRLVSWLDERDRLHQLSHIHHQDELSKLVTSMSWPVTDVTT